MGTATPPPGWAAEVAGRLAGAAVALVVVVGMPAVAGVLLGGTAAISITVCACVFSAMVFVLVVPVPGLRWTHAAGRPDAERAGASGE